MRIIRTLLRWLGLAVLAVIVAGWAPAYLGAYGLYWKRYAGSFVTNPLNPAYRWYEPLEPVKGAYSMPLPVGPADAFEPGALEGAADYAGSHHSDSLLVMHQGKLVFSRYWNGKGPDSPFAAHSMTKTLNAVLMGFALADGSIRSIDDPAYFYVAEWDDPAYRAITIRDLLYMASGLKESYDFAPWSLRMQRTMGTDIVSANVKTKVGGPPGVKFAHINPPPEILGIILQRATGKRYADYLSEKVWSKIGAHDARMFVDRPGGMVHTDCCMWTAIEDWARIGELLRTGGAWNGAQVLPPDWVDKMLGTSPANINYGMMIWLGSQYEKNRVYDPDVPAFANHHGEPFAATDVFFLDGLHLQRVWVVPSKQLVIVRTGQGDDDWDDSRLPNLVIRGLKK